jgi:hypothetical protein
LATAAAACLLFFFFFFFLPHEDTATYVMLCMAALAGGMQPGRQEYGRMIYLALSEGSIPIRMLLPLSLSLSLSLSLFFFLHGDSVVR